ncbi:MAG TPA: hypothetical protein PKD90_06955 [Phnomibacter sp.]|nr:hypothetical protein [Phnomibacter sp.]
MLIQNEERSGLRASLVKKVAAKHGLTKWAVYKIIRGDRQNDAVFADYMAMKEIADNIEHLQDNPLMEAVLATVPYNQ